MKIISVTGGKGGVGKSSISVNLALGLAQLGGRVLLLDGDLGLANADQLLGVHAPSTLFDVVQNRIDLSGAVLDTPWQVALLPTCSGRKEMAELNGDALQAVIDGIRGLRDLYDYVIVDTAAGIGEVSLSLAGVGDIILAVATPDPTSVRDVFSVMKILSKEYGARRISLVANKVSSRDEGLSLFKRLSSVTGRFLPLSLGFAGAIVRDSCLARSIVDRRPLLASYPGSPASKQIGELAAHLVTMDREMHDVDVAIDDKERGSS